jgi:hypothetical protein
MKKLLLVRSLAVSTFVYCEKIPCEVWLSFPVNFEKPRASATVMDCRIYPRTSLPGSRRAPIIWRPENS